MVTPWYRQKVTKIVISKGIDNIGSGAFYHCKELENVSLSQGLKKIGEHAFNGCPKLKEINFPEGLEEIEFFAFENSELLSEVHLPSSVQKIGLGVFPTGCKVVSEFINGEKEKIAQALVEKKHILVESSINESIVREVATAAQWEMTCECDLSAHTPFLTNDGGVMIDGKTYPPQWATLIVKNPQKMFVVFIDYLDHITDLNYTWLKSVLNHIIAGRVVNNYIVVGRVIGGVKEF